MAKKKLKEFMKASDIKGVWSFMVWLISTKEFLKFVIIALIALLIIFFSQSIKCQNKYFRYDPVIKKIEIER